ncbi:uncharacterized protein LOC134718045 [Mytilus trossulus]|uniref:uncharacterized protein LOC134718045 n=1 Tax=Mytilus trossulus TaxID=6551 RepID=UPI003006CF54
MGETDRDDYEMMSNNQWLTALHPVLMMMKPTLDGHEDVNKQIGLSPGVHTKRLSILRDIQARKRKAISVTRKEKIRRIQLRNRPRRQSRDSHITQIAAVSGDNHWSCYVTPKIPITNQAIDINGIKVRNGRVFHQGTPVDSLSITKAMEDFIKGEGDIIYLGGHNIKTFDCHVLINTLKCIGKSNILNTHVQGFLDTRLLFKINNPELKSFSQINLLKTLLNCDYAAHDALQDRSDVKCDVTFLQKLMESSKIDYTDAKFSSATFTVPAAFHSFDQSASCKLNLPTLLEFVDNKVLSIGMARRIAASNLNKASLLIAFSRGQENGLQQLFSEECGKEPRVTRSSKIIHAVSKYISEHLIES